MDAQDGLAQRFETHRPHLRAVAYRMLGSLAEADDAVQEAWLRLHRTDGVDNLGGWLTTVVGRIALDMLRSRTTRNIKPPANCMAKFPSSPAAIPASGAPPLWLLPKKALTSRFSISANTATPKKPKI